MAAYTTEAWCSVSPEGASKRVLLPPPWHPTTMVSGIRQTHRRLFVRMARNSYLSHHKIGHAVSDRECRASGFVPGCCLHRHGAPHKNDRGATIVTAERVTLLAQSGPRSETGINNSFQMSETGPTISSASGETGHCEWLLYVGSCRRSRAGSNDANGSS